MKHVIYIRFLNPATNALTAANRARWEEDIEVILPAKGVISKIDVYFLADTTSSMGPVVAAVQEGIANIVDGLRSKADEVGADLCFGVGNYRDMDYDPPEWFQHQQSVTSEVKAVKDALNQWKVASTGKDIPEGQLYALDQVAHKPELIGWRNDAKRIVVWLGDAPGHDPICSKINGLGYDVTETLVTGRLKEQQIFVLSISTPSGSSGPGLNVDPKGLGNSDTYKPCGDPGGSENQGKRIAEATCGEAADGIRPDDVVATILLLGGAQIQTVQNVSLAASKKIKPFVTAIEPAEGYGPFSALKERKLSFHVTFSGVSVDSARDGKAITEKVEGTLDVLADSKDSRGRKKVVISVPDLRGKYKIQCTQNGSLLQLENPTYTKDGGNVNYGEDANKTHQQWELTPATGGGYYIKNLDTKKNRYLEVAGQSTENRTEILTRDSTIGQHKQWRLIPVGMDDDGILIYKIENLKTGKVIDAQNAHKGNVSGKASIRVVQFHYWGDHPVFHQKHNQHWRLVSL